jgi:hypothetical protein
MIGMRFHSTTKAAILVGFGVILFFTSEKGIHTTVFGQEKGKIQSMKERFRAAPWSALLRRKNKNDFVETSRKTKEALVNIICLPKSSSLPAISGSGVIIDKRGIILTNAHIAQYFLFENSSACTIRTGSPAKPAHTASLFYIPPRWVTENAPMIKNVNAVGTGENDFAFLQIDDSPDTSPKSFPFLNMRTSDIEKAGDEVLAVGYPAGVLGGIALSRDLYAVSAVVTIHKIQSFDEINKDFLLLSPSAVAEKGSSGGAVVNKNNELVGLIVSVQKSGTGLQGELGTLSLSHLDRSLKNGTGRSLSSFLMQDPADLVSKFKAETTPEFLKKYSGSLR